MSTTPHKSGNRAAGYQALRNGVGQNKEALQIIATCETGGISAEAAALAVLESGAVAQTEQQDRACYAASQSLQREFASLDHYLAFRRSQRGGRIRHYRRGG